MGKRRSIERHHTSGSHAYHLHTPIRGISKHNNQTMENRYFHSGLQRRMNKELLGIIALTLNLGDFPIFVVIRSKISLLYS